MACTPGAQRFFKIPQAVQAGKIIWGRKNPPSFCNFVA